MDDIEDWLEHRAHMGALAYSTRVFSTDGDTDRDLLKAERVKYSAVRLNNAKQH